MGTGEKCLIAANHSVNIWFHAAMTCSVVMIKTTATIHGSIHSQVVQANIGLVKQAGVIS